MDCKKIIFISLILCSSKIYSQVICEGLKIIPTVSFNQCKANPWLLIFEDNFNGNSLDLSKWAFGPRIRFCNDEQQYYTNGQNVEVSNGVLKLIAKKDTVFAKADDGVADNVNLYCKGVD